MVKRAVSAAAALGAMVAIGGHPAAAIEASGKAVAVQQDAAISGPGGNRALAVNSAVFTGDAIKTNQRGTAQILFADDTKMVVGPNSQVTIDKFVFQGSSAARTFAIDALRGSFRFITGVSAKNAYTIKTPTATIGVRGTAFDGSVAKDGTTTIAMWHGTVRICDMARPRRHCAEISGACSVIQLGPQAPFKWVKNVYERTDLVDHTIPFAFRQGQLASAFRVSSSGCEVHDFDAPPNANHTDATPPPAPQGSNSPQGPTPPGRSKEPKGPPPGPSPKPPPGGGEG